ncbi:MAG: FAD-dependent oxidoreductase, partial [Verrucomicrobiae bacterium]|nr:FAD-dependent oxidoreductase [Verrucomicrobiae bacterium]
IMGSPYLLAHGLGEPVKDATTTVTFPSTGNYRVLVRTKDWVARWKAPGAPGKFQLLVNGQPLKETFGTKGAEWFWHDGGTVRITKPQVTLALRDLTGFDGRCDAILFTKDKKFTPPNDKKPLPPWRRELLGLPEKPVEAGSYDLVVVGGGLAGLGAAVSAARMGCKVALIQDRPVLGGNSSSEIRVWPQGRTRTGLYPRLGEIIEEFAGRPKKSPGEAEEFNDAGKLAAAQAEKNLALFLNTRAFAVEKSGDRIAAVLAFSTTNSTVRRFAGRLFCDATGHGTLGALAGADLRVQEKGHMGMSNMWRWKKTDRPVIFRASPWALNLEIGDFPYPSKGSGDWFWETGFDKDPIEDLEYMRDWNFRAIYGAFDAMKNKDSTRDMTTAQLEWVAYIGGTRESRQLLGDVILTRDDIVGKKMFPDGCVPTTWSIDLHYPKKAFAQKTPDDPFISDAEFDRSVDPHFGYPVPYRCFYSRNIRNLFMAGRCISVTHEALGTVRVMKTCGMMGEVVGKAASICIRHNCAPRDVYHNYLDELKELMRLRGVARRDKVDGPIYIPPDAKELPPPPLAENAAMGLDPAKLPGIVVDDTHAKLTGKWNGGSNLEHVGMCYLYASPKARASARFEFNVKTTGNYEVRLAYQSHENRASNAPVTVHSADGPKTLAVNQRAEPPIPPIFVSLGVFRFEAGKPGAVEFKTEGADGNVGADAVQVLPAK